jgi:hypothetical protein
MEREQPNEMANKVCRVKLCHLLSFCGLGWWSECHPLPPILANLKRASKNPPPIPTNDAELLQLDTEYVMVLKAFFVEWSSLVQQETDLMTKFKNNR